MWKTGYHGSLRVPARWVGVERKPEKHDQVTLMYNACLPVTDDIYGGTADVLPGNALVWKIDVQGMRHDYVDFFRRVGAVVGRRVAV